MKKRKKFKGMTLVEVLVALAVFSIISALLASAVAGVCDIYRKTDKLNKKISIEAPKIEQKDMATENLKEIEFATMVIKISGADPTAPTYSVDYDKYTVNDKDTNGSGYYEQGGDLKYFEAK